MTGGEGEAAIDLGLLDDARRASEDAVARREEAREEALRFVRALERRLREAVEGDGLRGLANLAGDAGEFRAARVGGSRAHGVDSFLPRDGRESLVIARDGQVSVARFFEGSVSWRAVRDDEVRAEHALLLALAAEEVLRRHVARARAASAEYVAARDLALRLAGALYAGTL